MIQRRTIDLLDEENEPELPSEIENSHIDETFVLNSSLYLETVFGRSTKKKFQILDWNSIDRQLRSYGFNKVDDLSLHFIDDNDKKHVQNRNSEVEFDFRSDSIPFSAKYNVAIALTYSEAISILSNDDNCEIYASQEIKRIFNKYKTPLHEGLNNINFKEMSLEMKKELIWPIVQNLYRALTVRKAVQVFPEGISGKIACEALLSECKNDELSVKLSEFSALKYSDYETVYFSDPSDLEIKYHIANYCLEHVGEIKAQQNPEKKEPDKPDKNNEEKTPEDDQKRAEAMKTLEDEYISAFKRINKNKSFWEKLNFNDILDMGKDVISAIREEARMFAKLRQEIIYRLGGRSKIFIEDDELYRIMRGRNPSFEIASQYLNMFFQPSDYYTILGLNNAKSVTEKEIKDAFKKLAKIYHPDKNPNDPHKEEKEQRFKLLLEAKDALLKKLNSKENLSGFRDDVSLSNYLGSISKLFDGFAKEEKVDIFKEEISEVQEDFNVQEAVGMENVNENINMDQKPIKNDEYLGPYLDEIRMLESLTNGWKDKEVLVLGAGREPENFSIPVILAQMGAKVSAIDINYNGPSEYNGCNYYRASVDRADQVFEGRQFDVMISTAVFGVPFTNWAIRQYSLNPFSDRFKERIKQLELEVFGILVKITKKGGWHFHYNKDLNPQSWNFTEDDLKKLGYESAFHPEKLPDSQGIWFLQV
ncbi:MAG: hypothetical protein QG588_899 [Candidatus Poribacteria bacterium]|nr:hypothetical protein [Candidatus Poribacteria bacterium]